MQDNPFPGIQVDSWSFLEELSTRQPCPRCKKSRKYFCYTCLIALPNVKERIPHVKLPIKVDIIKHPSEIDGKSTSTHAAILASDDVTIHTYPHIPDYGKEKVAIIFPGKDSVTLDDLLEDNINTGTNRDDTKLKNFITCPSQDQSNFDSNTNTHSKSQENTTYHHSQRKEGAIIVTANETRVNGSEEIPKSHLNDQQSIIETESGTKKRTLVNSEDTNNSAEEVPQKVMKMFKRQLPFERVIFIDSTWNQTSIIIDDERLKDFLRVELTSRQGNFWRKQEGIPDTYLSTIEAIYYFIKDLHIAFIDSSYNHEYDNLLFLFCFMHQKISNSQGAMEQRK